MKPSYIGKVKEEFDRATGKPTELKWAYIDNFLRSPREKFVSTKRKSRSDFDGYSEWEILILLTYGELEKERTESTEGSGGGISDKVQGSIFVCRQVWIWKKMMAVATIKRLPLLALSVLYQGDMVFSGNAKEINELYSLGEAKEQEDVVMELRSGNTRVSQVFTPACEWLADEQWMNPSKEFKELLALMRKLVPKNEPAAEPEKKAMPSAEPEKSAPQPIQAGGAWSLQLPPDIAFLQHQMLPPFLQPATEMYQRGLFAETEKYLAEVCRERQLRRRQLFLVYLLRLHCLWQLPDNMTRPEQRLRPMLEALWLQMYELQPDVDMEKLDNVVLARWEPALFAELLNLTLQYSQKFNQNQGFQASQLSGGKQLSEDLLRRHLAMVAWI